MTVVGMTPGRKEGFSELSVISSICSNLLQTVQAFSPASFIYEYTNKV